MTDSEIGRLLTHIRRGLWLADCTKLLLFAGLVLGLAGWVPGAAQALSAQVSLAVIALVVLLWILLSYLSVRQGRATNLSSRLLAAGYYDNAEPTLRDACMSYSLYRSVKLVACHNLSLFAHGRENFHQAATVCRVLLRQKRGSLHSLIKMCYLVLADSLLHLGQLHEAHHALERVRRYELTLSEKLVLLGVEVRYLLKAGQPQEIVRDLPDRVQLAELLPSRKAAAIHALLAAACHATGQVDKRDYLWRRARLYADPEELRPELRELAAAPDWPPVAASLHQTTPPESATPPQTPPAPDAK